MNQRRWFHFAVFCTLVGVGFSTEVFELVGCAAFKSTEKDCFVNDVEVLPSIHISESAIHAGVKTAEDCQKKCLESYDCKYFTFRTNKGDRTTTCHLKPAPGGAAAPMMVVRTYPLTSKYSYVSGPADCHVPCKDWKELVPGCGGSSPSSCALMSNGNAGFDASCSTTPSKKGCQYNGFACCLDCKEGQCCKTRVKGKILVDGTLLGAEAVGVATPEHCHSLCIATDKCTHWNYVESSTSAYIGGACYRRTYDPVNAPIFEAAPTYANSVIGSVDCSKDYGLEENPNPEKPCLQEKVDFFNDLSIRQDGQSMEKCGELCRNTPACHFYMMKWNHCYLKFSDDGKVNTTETTIVARRNCHTTDVDDGCLLLSTEYIGTPLYPPQWSGAADACSRSCDEDSRCQAWTYTSTSTQCTLWKSIDKSVTKKSVISGKRDCVLPSLDTRRLDDHINITLPPHCIQKGKSFSGERLISIQTPDTVMTVEECYSVCLRTQHCNMLSTTADGHVCDLYRTGTLVDVLGVNSVLRECPRTAISCGGSSGACSTAMPDDKPSVSVA